MRDALEVLDLTLTLPIGGKTYRVDPPTAAVGVRLQNLLAKGLVVDALAEHFDGADIDAARADLVLDGDTQTDFARDCLGATYDQLLTDDVPAPVLELATGTAFLAWTVGKGAAEAWWESGGKAPTRTATPSRPGHPTATPTRKAAANTTRTPSYPSGTSRKTKRRKGSR